MKYQNIHWDIPQATDTFQSLDKNNDNKSISVLGQAAPLFMLYKIGEIVYNFLTFNVVSLDLISHFLAATILACGFAFPFTKTGKGYRAILKSLKLKHKTKKYYKKMHTLEKTKTNINAKRVTEEQRKVTKRFLKKLMKITNKNNKIQEKYKKIAIKKGYVDGLKAFVSDNIDSYQEAVDKFIFHNRSLLIKLCPEYKGFVDKIFMDRYTTIVTGENYYDEYIWSAFHNDDILIKNDCINKNETSNYLQELYNIFKSNMHEEQKEIKAYEYTQNKQQKVLQVERSNQVERSKQVEPLKQKSEIQDEIYYKR